MFYDSMTVKPCVGVLLQSPAQQIKHGGSACRSRVVQLIRRFFSPGLGWGDGAFMERLLVEWLGLLQGGFWHCYKERASVSWGNPFCLFPWPQQAMGAIHDLQT